MTFVTFAPRQRRIPPCDCGATDRSDLGGSSRPSWLIALRVVDQLRGSSARTSSARARWHREDQSVLV